MQKAESPNSFQSKLIQLQIQDWSKSFKQGDFINRKVQFFERKIGNRIRSLTIIYKVDKLASQSGMI